MTGSSKKAVYVAPQLIELGTFEEMTQATSSGPDLDSFVAVHHAVAGHLS